SGDVARWVKFANTLRLRLAMRVSYVDPALATAQATAAINEVHGLMSSVADDAILHQGNGLTFTNSLWEVTQSWADLGMSATADCYLNGYNDPRLEKYYVKNTEGVYRGARNGVVNPQSALLQTKVSAANFSQNSDQPWMKHAEAYFLQAEAKLRLGVGNGDVQSLYEEGVRASFSSAGVNSGVDSYLASTDLPVASWVNPQGERSVDVSSMLSQVTPAFDATASQEKQLEQIITQKWIAL
ncbi:SusD/RagB family nutrient-binding outer membrane lipoprotein, partial [Muribaculum intestinale]